MLATAALFRRLGSRQIARDFRRTVPRSCYWPSVGLKCAAIVNVDLRIVV